MFSQMNFSYDSKPIATIMNEINNKGRQGGIDLQPSYQRGYVWTNDFKEKLIYSIIRQYPIGNISLRNNLGIKEVVDGQQRLTTIYNFLDEATGYEVKGEYARKIVEYIINYFGEGYEDPDLEKLKKRLDNKTGIKIKFKQLPEVIRENIKAYNISFTNITNASDSEITEFFRFLQNQERLKAGEIINSIPDTPLEEYLDKLISVDVFLKKISFQNARKNFDKHFYSVIGVLTEQLNYGVPDKEVISFSSEVKEEDLENNQLISNMIENVNKITELEFSSDIEIGTSNVRSLKYLLLLCAFSDVDFSDSGEEKLVELLRLNDKLSSFNSAKTGAIEKEFKNYNPEVIEDLRAITLLSKGAHPFDRVKNRMKILADYINQYPINEQTKPSQINLIN
ncbi:DUF262 domain-containing protein [Erysipelothrix rhusiopathiae]|nr:DUF262 domain-containing protein [Erysipelothrix rhusiopathiae]MDE8166967.1 DUF262 domain-containing protein [Erysipelothrix rhusiopathiae]MDE8209522.1 DUF262 domain-containing protein [Erysipelothrix rhusiopathiae]